MYNIVPVPTQAESSHGKAPIQRGEGSDVGSSASGGGTSAPTPNEAVDDSARRLSYRERKKLKMPLSNSWKEDEVGDLRESRLVAKIAAHAVKFHKLAEAGKIPDAAGSKSPIAKALRKTKEMSLMDRLHRAEVFSFEKKKDFIQRDLQSQVGS